jgi:hypothetical protein
MDRVGGRCVEDERRGKIKGQAGSEELYEKGIYRRRGGVEKRRRRVGNISRRRLHTYIV